jgi:hypothetical protein
MLFCPRGAVLVGNIDAERKEEDDMEQECDGECMQTTNPLSLYPVDCMQAQ